MLHDCIYQFLRLFYHSRFKPTQLEMTWAQFATPVIDVVLVLPLILKLVQNISEFTNEAKMSPYIFSIVLWDDITWWA